MLNAKTQCIVALSVVVVLGATVSEAAQPNFLFIMPDQMRGMDMGCMGNTDVKTPHLDRLATEGILFRRMFANTPVCCPARAIILTGQYPHTNGMVCNDLRLRESATTVAELLAAKGYRTGFIGKWHLDGGKRQPGYVPPGPRRQGFKFWAAFQCSHRNRTGIDKYATVVGAGSGNGLAFAVDQNQCRA